jgi:DNA-binding XRE family transcriptional regulator
MPADNLEALFARARPGVPREQLAEEAGIALHQLNYLFRHERPDRLPKWTMIRAVAKMLDVSVNDVVQAMAADDGINLESEAEQDEQELLTDYRALSRRDKRAARAVIRTLGECP